MPSLLRSLSVLAALTVGGTTPRAQLLEELDLVRVREAAHGAVAGLEDVDARWLQGVQEEAVGEQTDPDRRWSALFGFSPPGRALQAASLFAFLYQRQGDPRDAQAAAGLLQHMAGYRNKVPESLRTARVEYRGGLPPIPSFFQLADYARAWSRVRHELAIDPGFAASVEWAIAKSAEFVFVFPEWGPHNRAMLRAECLAWCARALPEDAGAPRWRKMAAILAADSVRAWQIEDAQHYQPIWLQALWSYSEAVEDPSLTRTVQVRHLLSSTVQLLSPAGVVPAYGDSWWRGNLARTYACLAWGASVFQDPELAWGAERVFRALRPGRPLGPDLGLALLYARLFDYLPTVPAPRQPVARSGPVVDDVVGKKIVFREGFGDDDLYLLLNYRDEGDWGVLFRDYLRQTLAVEEEKMHHGHADENSIVLLMDRGAVLLHDAGYREQAPSGPFGAWRADLFHNRLVVRRGQRAADQQLLEFLRDSGRYLPVRTERVDFARVLDVDYSRTRVEDQQRGVVWDRVLVFVPGVRAFVVFDIARAQRAGALTLANLWAVQHVVARGDCFAVGRTEQIAPHQVGGDRELLLVFRDELGGGAPQDFALIRHRQEERVLHRAVSRQFELGESIAFTTVLWPVDAGADAAALAGQVRAVAADGGVAVEIAHGDEQVLLGCKLDLNGGLRRGDLRPRYTPEGGRIEYRGGVTVATDADLVVVRRRGDRARWGAAGMTHVLVDGVEAFAAQPFQVFQTSGRSDVVGQSKWRRWDGEVELSGAADRRPR